VFGGIDTGGDVEVTNPANFSDSNDLPAPILMDLSVGDYDMSQPHHDLGVRRNVFTFMGVSRLNNEPLVWPNRFRGTPFPAVVGLAQAEIFNTTSWDFWTQDWKVKLVPMALWSDWMQRMRDTAPDADQTNGLVDMQNVLELHEYLSRFDQSLVNVMMQH